MSSYSQTLFNPNSNHLPLQLTQQLFEVPQYEQAGETGKVRKESQSLNTDELMGDWKSTNTLSSINEEEENYLHQSTLRSTD